MREIDVGEIIKAVEELCIKANKILPDDLCGCISCAEKTETDELPKKIMGTLLENLDAAKELDCLFARIPVWRLFSAMWVRTRILSAVILKMP